MNSTEPDKKSDRAGSTSHSLIDQLKHNESDGWKRLFHLYEPLVAFWCRKAGVTEQDSPDLIQDVFQTVARSINQFSATRSTGSFRGWLRTITHSRIIDWRRKNQHKARAVGGSTAQTFMASQPFADSCSTNLEDELIQREQQAVRELYLRALKIIRDNFREKTWQAFQLVVIQQKTPDEAAAALGISPSTVRVAKSRILHRLRAELGELYD